MISEGDYAFTKCKKCNGEGVLNHKTCKFCSGEGEILQDLAKISRYEFTEEDAYDYDEEDLDY